VVADDLTRAEAVRLAERIGTSLSRSMRVGDLDVALTVSIGIACVRPTSNRSHYGFIQLADEALYEAKERGRNCIVVRDKEYGDLSTGSFRKGPAEASSRR